MPRGKKADTPGEGTPTPAPDRLPEPTGAKADPGPSAGRTRTRARRATPAAPPDQAETPPAVGDPLAGLAGDLRALREQLAEVRRETEAQAQATREERAAVRREVTELRDQVRDSYHKALREALDGLEKVRAGATDVPAGLRESIGTATDDARRLAQAVREARQEMAGLVQLHQFLREHTASLAREVHDADARARAMREGSGREVNALREQSRAAYLDFLRTALEGLERVRTEAAGTAAQLNDVRRLAQEVGQRLVQDVKGQLGTVREELREASTALHELPWQAEESRQRVEEVLQRLAEVEPTREPAGPTGLSEGHTRLGVTVQPGVVVETVVEGGPADGAGVSPGDVIGAVNERAIQSATELRDELHRIADGEKLALRLTRGNVSQDVTVRLPPATPGGPDTSEGRNRLGLTVVPGVVVAAVLAGSPAEAAGVSPGDVIGAVDGEAVLSGEDLRSAILDLPERAETTLQLTRGQEAREVKVRLDEPEE
jgi:uncharacterized coiled-coil DUF342 family protein